MATDNKIGFKKITIDNWLTPDELWPRFFRISSKTWLKRNLRPALKETVPIEVRQLFEVARGALIYGYLFYPLCSLAEAQLYRVMEAAVFHKCKRMGADKSIGTFYKKVNLLIEMGVIPQQEKQWWDAVRDLRNITSHPEKQMIVPPADTLAVIMDKLHSLFGSHHS